MTPVAYPCSAHHGREAFGRCAPLVVRPNQGKHLSLCLQRYRKKLRHNVWLFNTVKDNLR